MVNKRANIYEINTTNWQKKRGACGEVVTDLDDIEQCYDTIINVSKGDIPLQPNIGCNIFEAVGQKTQNALQIVKTIILKEFPIQEPRGEIVEINTSYDENGKIVVDLTFQSKQTKAERIKKYYV